MKDVVINYGVCIPCFKAGYRLSKDASSASMHRYVLLINKEASMFVQSFDRRYPTLNHSYILLPLASPF